MGLQWIIIPYVVVVAVLIVLRMWTKKRFLNAILAVVLLAGAAFVAYRQFMMPVETSPLEEGEIYEVARGNIAEVVEATGNLAPVTQATLSFDIPGRLMEIRVVTGQTVRAGEVLATVGTEDLKLQLAQAQAAIDVAEANRAKLLAGARPEDVEVAQSGLNQAWANQEELRVTLSAATEQARLSWIQAANVLRDAQQAYENIYWDNREWEQKAKKWGGELSDAQIDAEAQAWRAVENAEAAMEQARLTYEQAKQRQDTSVRAAWAQVSSAQANLDRLTNGATVEDVAATDAAIEQARASYDLAQAQLEKASLKAPFAGVVATVLADVYNYVTSATPILILQDLSSYTVDVEVDEVDISKVTVGLEAFIVLDALPDAELPAEVEEVALSPSPSQGIVTYRVRVRVTDLQGADVRPGMTANVGIITQRAEGVLIVPRRAVRIVDGQAFVERVLADDQLESVEVEVGLEDPFFVEIVSGLQEGDSVFVRGVVQGDLLHQLMQDPSSARGFRFGR